MTRQALHADRLAFTHPLTGRPMAFRAPPPEDFRQALQAWSLRYNESDWLDEEPSPRA